MQFKDLAPLGERKAIAVQVKADSEGRVSGYASRFGERDQGGDIVIKGAFQRSLSENRLPKMLWQHDPSQPIGVWEDVGEDDSGLYVRGRILDTVEKGREARALIEAGAIEGMSIGYRTVKADRDTAGNRLLTDLDLWEISMVTFPMLTSAKVDSYKAAEQFEQGNHALMKRLLEDNLREAGFSNSQAKAGSSAAVNKLVSMREAHSGLAELAQYMRQNSTGQKE